MHSPKPFYEGYLPEQDGHTVYFAQYGNPDGPAILSLHGGPGSKSKPKHVAGFDLSRFHLITFDQRGCGKSEATNLLQENTTQTLIADMERLRSEIGLDQWFITGGSWGATLALLYAETRPTVISGLLLSAVFLADQASMVWGFTADGALVQLFPDVWSERVNLLKSIGLNDPTPATILEALTSGSESERQVAAAAVANWEGNLLTSRAPVSLLRSEEVEEADIAAATLFTHYEANSFFIADQQILNNSSYLETIPTVIVHGRHDVLCPYRGAWELHQAIPASELVTLPESNHKLTIDGEEAKTQAFNSFLARTGR